MKIKNIFSYKYFDVFAKSSTVHMDQKFLQEDILTAIIKSKLN